MTFSPTRSPGSGSKLQSPARAISCSLNARQWAMASSSAASTACDTVAAASSSSVTRSCSGASVDAVEAGERVAHGVVAAGAHVVDQRGDRLAQRRVEDVAEPRGHSAARAASSMSAQRMRRITASTVSPRRRQASTRGDRSSGTVGARAGHRRRRRPVGRRGQGQGHRPAGQGARLRRALPGRSQRRPHRRRRRRALRPAADPERDPLRPRRAGHRQRRRRRPADAVRRDRRARVARRLVRPPAGVEPRPPDLPVAPGPRRHRRGDARRRQDRHHAEGHRPGLRRQGPAGRPARRRRADPPSFAEHVKARAVAENRELEAAGGEPLDVDEIVDRFAALGARLAPVRRRHRRRCCTTRSPAASTCCSRARRRPSSTSTTARIRTSRRPTRPPAAPAPARASGRATSTASSASPRRTRHASAPDRSPPS